MPIVFAISYVILTLENKSIAREFLIGGIYGSIASIIFSLVLIYFNAQFLKTHWLNFTFAYLLCFLVAFGLAYATSK